LLVAGCWSLAAGFRLLAGGFWLLVGLWLIPKRQRPALAGRLNQ